MKKVFIALAVCTMAMSSCIMPSKSYQSMSIVDYARYYEQDFFITESNSVSFGYKPVGSVHYVLKGEKKVVHSTPEQQSAIDEAPKYSMRHQKYNADRVNSPKPKKTTNSPKPTKTKYRFTIYDALDELTANCRQMGADGIINLSISYTFDKDFGAGYEIKGMAVKRDKQ